MGLRRHIHSTLDSGNIEVSTFGLVTSELGSNGKLSQAEMTLGAGMFQ